MSQPDLVTLRDPRAAASEAYRTLRTNLMFSNVDAAYKTFAVTSPTADENKSTILANLAVTLAQSEHQTIIVDADLRHPSQHTIWQADNQHGLTDMLLNEAAFDAPPFASTPVENLHLLTTGTLPANPADVFVSQRMDAVISRLADLADYVLFDVSPVLAVTDAAVLGRKLDGVLLVVQAGITRRDKIVRAKEQMERVQANLIGVALTNAPATNTTY